MTRRVPYLLALVAALALAAPGLSATCGEATDAPRPERAACCCGPAEADPAHCSVNERAVESGCPCTAQQAPDGQTPRSTETERTVAAMRPVGPVSVLPLPVAALRPLAASRDGLVARAPLFLTTCSLLC